jgi:hypothetical protein
MATLEDWQFLIDALDPLRGPLHEQLPSAADVAEDHFAEFDMYDKEYQAGRAHLARCHARRLLKVQSASNLGGWKVARPGPNAALWLTRDALRLRLLRPLPGMEVPPPGPNHTRIAYYSNQHVSILGVSGSDLIGLWDIDGAGEATIRIVRPIGRWRYGANSKVDIDFQLPRLPQSLRELEFRPTDDLGLPLPFENEDEEGEEGTGGGTDRPGG